MAQVAHATSAVLHETRERAETMSYLDDLKHMRKVRRLCLDTTTYG
jgi:hypothetical protein